jgi:hypothetical protein
MRPPRQQRNGDAGEQSVSFAILNGVDQGAWKWARQQTAKSYRRYTNRASFKSALVHDVVRV